MSQQAELSVLNLLRTFVVSSDRITLEGLASEIDMLYRYAVTDEAVEAAARTQFEIGQEIEQGRDPWDGADRTSSDEWAAFVPDSRRILAAAVPHLQTNIRGES